MMESAAQLADQFIPRPPMRQCVLAMPNRLRAQLARTPLIEEVRTAPYASDCSGQPNGVLCCRQMLMAEWAHGDGFAADAEQRMKTQKPDGLALLMNAPGFTVEIHAARLAHQASRGEKSERQLHDPQSASPKAFGIRQLRAHCQPSGFLGAIVEAKVLASGRPRQKRDGGQAAKPYD